MGGRRRCCCLGCIIFRDLFNRADASTPGETWEVRLGDWPIVSQRLRELGTKGAVVIGPRHPWDTATGLAYVDLVNPQPNKRYRIVINWEDDRNYNWAGLACAATGTDAYLEVGQVVGGVDSAIRTVLTTYTPGTDIRLSACRNYSGIYALSSLGSNIAWSVLPSGSPAGRYWGLGNGGTTALDFDNFEFWEHFVTDDACPVCPCDCGHYAVKRRLLLTFVVVQTCSCLDGQSLELNHEEDNLFNWHAEGRLPEFGCTPDSPWVMDDYEFDLRCPGGGSNWEDWLLCNRAGTPGGGAGGWKQGISGCGGDWGAYPSTGSCNPLSLTYGPFQAEISGQPPYICIYYMVVTENPA